MAEADFNQACEDIKHLTSKPSDDDLKEIYGLFKQATIGDVNTSRPGMIDFKGKAKWDAWKGKEGMKKEAAMQAYIQKASNMKETYGFSG